MDDGGADTVPALPIRTRVAGGAKFGQSGLVLTTPDSSKVGTFAKWSDYTPINLPPTPSPLVSMGTPAPMSPMQYYDKTPTPMDSFPCYQGGPFGMPGGFNVPTTYVQGGIQNGSAMQMPQQVNSIGSIGSLSPKTYCVCGNQFMDDSAFCRKCGQPRAQVIQQPQQIIQQPYQLDPSQQMMYMQQMMMQPQMMQQPTIISSNAGSVPTVMAQAPGQQMVMMMPVGGQQMVQMMTQEVAPVSPPQMDQQDQGMRNHLAGLQIFQEALDEDTYEVDESKVSQALIMGQPCAPPTGPLPSPGSALHGTGRCNPCAWFWKPKGCLNAANCSYCHLCPEGELKQRKKAKVVAMRMGALEPSQTGGSPPQIRLTQLLA